MITRIKEHMLRQELQELEYKVAKHYAYSVRKVELENKNVNIFKRISNSLESKEVLPEYHLLSKQLPAIEARIQQIKEQLKE